MSEQYVKLTIKSLFMNWCVDVENDVIQTIAKTHYDQITLNSLRI